MLIIVNMFVIVKPDWLVYKQIRRPPTLARSRSSPSFRSPISNHKRRTTLLGALVAVVQSSRYMYLDFGCPVFRSFLYLLNLCYLFLVRQVSEMQRGLVPVDGKVRRSEFELLSGTG